MEDLKKLSLGSLLSIGNTSGVYWEVLRRINSKTYKEFMKANICNGVHIYLSTWFPPFMQGWTLNSKRVFVKLVYDPTKIEVSIDATCDTIQHEMNHCQKIKAKGWINFYATEIWQYIWKSHDKAGYEPEAIKAEAEPNPPDLRFLVIKFCIDKKLNYY